ncbi:MAG: hypothetical protein WED05_01475 [Candidatus Atabeyarchaeum deiterrae]
MLRLYKKLPGSIRTRIAIELLPREEIHIEQVERTYRRLSMWLRRHSETRLMLCFSPAKPTERVLELYKWLITSFPNQVGLHVHICDDLYSPPLPLPNTARQYERIKTGLSYLNHLGIETKDFTSGHWSYDSGTFTACKRLGLTNVHIRCRYIPEMTEKYGVPKGIRIMPVVRHVHDYEI